MTSTKYLFYFTFLWIIINLWSNTSGFVVLAKNPVKTLVVDDTNTTTVNVRILLRFYVIFLQ